MKIPTITTLVDFITQQMMEHSAVRRTGFLTHGMRDIKCTTQLPYLLFFANLLVTQVGAMSTHRQEMEPITWFSGTII
jgi:hypothetical protein